MKKLISLTLSLALVAMLFAGCGGSKQTGVKELTLATSVGAFSSIKNYFDLFDYDIDQLVNVLK